MIIIENYYSGAAEWFTFDVICRSKKNLCEKSCEWKNLHVEKTACGKKLGRKTLLVKNFAYEIANKNLEQT
jgi:hypothetical protein